LKKQLLLKDRETTDVSRREEELMSKLDEF